MNNTTHRHILTHTHTHTHTHHTNTHSQQKVGGGEGNVQPHASESGRRGVS